jgi:hypothetical protein
MDFRIGLLLTTALRVSIVELRDAKQDYGTDYVVESNLRLIVGSDEDFSCSVLVRDGWCG